MDILELHKGLITRTAGQIKLKDLCTRPLQDKPASMRASLAKNMPASMRASLAKEMHASEPGHHACIPCMLQLVMTRSPNHTLINNCNLQVTQSAQEAPGTQAPNPGTQEGHDARIPQAKRRTRRVHQEHDARISWPPKMPASCIEHMPMGVVLAC